MEQIKKSMETKSVSSLETGSPREIGSAPKPWFLLPSQALSIHPPPSIPTGSGDHNNLKLSDMHRMRTNSNLFSGNID